MINVRLACNALNNMHSAGTGNDRAVMRSNERIDLSPGHWDVDTNILTGGVPTLR